MLGAFVLPSLEPMICIVNTLPFDCTKHSYCRYCHTIRESERSIPFKINVNIRDELHLATRKKMLIAVIEFQDILSVWVFMAGKDLLDTKALQIAPIIG